MIMILSNITLPAAFSEITFDSLSLITDDLLDIFVHICFLFWSLSLNVVAESTDNDCKKHHQPFIK